MTDTGQLRTRDRATLQRQPRVVDLTRAVAFGAGVVFAVLGAVTLLRTGLAPSLASPHVVVGWFHHTPLWGLIVLVLGIGMLATATAPVPDRAGLAGFGIFAAVFGLVVLIEPDPFHASLGIHGDTGWMFLIVGAVSALAGWLSPITLSGVRR